MPLGATFSMERKNLSSIWIPHKYHINILNTHTHTHIYTYIYIYIHIYIYTHICIYSCWHSCWHEFDKVIVFSLNDLIIYIYIYIYIKYIYIDTHIYIYSCWHEFDKVASSSPDSWWRVYHFSVVYVYYWFYIW